MGPNQKPTDGLALLDAINPISQGAGTANSAWVSVANYQRILAKIQTGVMGASATLDAKLQQATDSSGTGAKDITGKAITQIVKASGDNKTAFINAADTDLDLANGFNYVRLSMTVATAASLINGDLYGVVPRYEPPVDSGANPAINLGSANVVQIVG
jgi:hypothetical protein